MQENIRRLVIPARRGPERIAVAADLPGSAPADAAPPDGHVRVDVPEGDFAALKRILASLADCDRAEQSEEPASAARRVAEIMFNMRQERSRLFPASMFNEPAWDMLMALYVAHEVSAAADLARVTQTPITTAMRWIEYLESHKLIVRESSAADRRAHMVRLTDQARSSMDALFSGVVERWP